MDIKKSGVSSLDPFIIPTDVTFVIKQGDDADAEVSVHKFIIAMGSPVFAAQFCGKFKETKERVVVEDTTKEAFATMIDFVYGKTVDWNNVTVEEVFAIANMAEKYQVDDLMVKVKEVAAEFPVVDNDDAVTIAASASEFSQFEGLRDLFLIRCNSFLRLTLLQYQDIVKFADKYAGTDKSETVLKLKAMMKGKDIEVKNCCEKKSCRRGKPILSLSDIKRGDTVKMSRGFWAGREATVKGIIDVWTVYVEIEGLSGLVCGSLNTDDDGVPSTFLFCNC